jgi:chromosome segregation ATPase
LEDLQELRQHNQTLTEKLEQAAVTAGTQPSDTSDWESMKQRLLSELEDGDASTQHSQEEQTSLKNSMEIMDEIVLEKDDEIRELQRMLSEQTAIHASAEVSHGPSADDQEAVSNEPSDLQQLQSQWREKLGQAEVELATERAKISRDRNEIADQFAELQTERRRLEEFSASFSDPDLDSPKSKRVGRWFARLGLHHPEE